MRQLLLALVFLLSFRPAEAAEVVDRVVAIVNGSPILWSDLQRSRAELEKENRLAGRSEDLSDSDLLERLIDERLADQEAKKLDIEVSDKEIDSAIDDVLRQYGIDQEGLKARLLEQGVTFDEYRKKIAEQIRRLKLTNRAVRSRVVVDQNKMQAYYSKHRDEFKEDAKLHLQQLVFQGENAVAEANAVYELGTATPERLADEATKRNAQLVDLGIIRADRLSPQFAAMVKDLEPGQLAAPFKSSLGVQMLYLQERMPERIRTFEEVKLEIEDRLSREETERQFSKWLQELRDQSLIEVKL